MIGLVIGCHRLVTNPSTWPRGEQPCSEGARSHYPYLGRRQVSPSSHFRVNYALVPFLAPLAIAIIIDTEFSATLRTIAAASHRVDGPGDHKHHGNPAGFRGRGPRRAQNMLILWAEPREKVSYWEGQVLSLIAIETETFVRSKSVLGRKLTFNLSLVIAKHACPTALLQRACGISGISVDQRCFSNGPGAPVRHLLF